MIYNVFIKFYFWFAKTLTAVNASIFTTCKDNYFIFMSKNFSYHFFSYFCEIIF